MSKRPFVCTSKARQIVEENYSMKIKSIEELISHTDRNFKITVEQNSNVQSELNTGDNYILKIVNSKDSTSGGLECRRCIMEYLGDCGYVCTQVIPTNKHEFVCHDIFSTGGENRDKEETCAIQMLTFIPGETLKTCMTFVDENILHQLGEFVGKLHNLLETVSLTDKMVLERPDDPWVLSNIELMEQLIELLESEEQKGIIKQIIKIFKSEVVINYDKFTKGVMHNDLHNLNLIVNCEDGKFKPLYKRDDQSCDIKQIFGIIDFNDLTITYYILEVAMVIADFMCDTETVDSIDITAHFLSGYLKWRTLNQHELGVLYVCILAGFSRYIVLGENDFKNQPDNDYTRCGSDGAWYQLCKLWKLPKSSVINRWVTLLSDLYNIKLKF